MSATAATGNKATGKTKEFGGGDITPQDLEACARWLREGNTGFLSCAAFQ
jgi:hypothetical protein